MSIGIADIFGSVRLNLETGQFEIDAAKAADKAGATMGQRMKKAVGGLVGAGLGAGLGMALAGATKLDEATRQLQADTGMTAEEAKKAQAALAGMYRGNLQGFDEIAAAMANVHNDLGLTGEAAELATEQFLEFSTATGQDASEAVATFDDILDAWNLTAEDASVLMDGLIADHQRFGGVIAESEAALAAMAPAMQAANMEIEDGRALLNLFNASGIDAATAAAALKKAVTALKPGQSLDDLIARIGAIEDPTLRAQEAMRVFGARSGIGLAQAIQPGMTSLEDFAVSATEAAGATSEAASVIENSWGNRAKLALKQAQGYLAEVGTSMGDLVLVAGMLGPKMTTALMSGLGGLAGLLAPTLAKAWTTAAASGPVTSAITAAGTLMGTKAGLAISAGATAALIAAPIAITAFVVQWDDAEDAKAAKELADAVHKIIVTGQRDALAAARRDLSGRMDYFAGVIDKDAVAADMALVEQLIAEIDTALNAAGDKAERDWQLIYGGSMDVGAAAAKSEAAAAAVYGPWFSNEELLAGRLRAMGQRIPESIAQGVLDKQNAVVDAMNTLRTLMKEALTPGQQAARNIGLLMGDELAGALHDKRGAVRQEAQRVQQMAVNELVQLVAKGGAAGERAMDKLDNAIKNGGPKARRRAQRVKDAVLAELQKLETPAGTAGADAASAFTGKLKTGIDSGDFRISASIRFGQVGMYAEGGIAKAGQPAIFGEEGWELGIPEVDYRILSHRDSVDMLTAGPRGLPYAAGGGVVVNLNVSTPLMTPGSAQALADAVGPALTRWQQARGL